MEKYRGIFAWLLLTQFQRQNQIIDRFKSLTDRASMPLELSGLIISFVTLVLKERKTMTS